MLLQIHLIQAQLVLSYAVLAFGIYGFAKSHRFIQNGEVVPSLLFAIAVTPFAAATSTLVLTTVWPRCPIFVLAYLPSIIGLFLSYAYRSTFPPILLICSWIREGSYPRFFVAACVVAVGYSLLAHAVPYINQPTGNSDALQYLTQARQFLTHSSMFAYHGLSGTPDGVLRGDAHGALWITWLATNLAFAADADSFSADIIVRASAPLTIFSFLSAGALIGSLMGKRYAIFLTVMLLLAIPQISGSSINMDRDAFRLSGILALMALLITQTTSLIRHPLRRHDLALLAITAYWAQQGHGLSNVLVPAITLTWFITTTLLKQPFVRGLVVAISVAVGFSIGSFPIASAYLFTGSPLGTNVSATQVLEGTPYEKGPLLRDNGRIGAERDFPARSLLAVSRDNGWPSIIAITSLLVLAIQAPFFLGNLYLRNTTAHQAAPYIPAILGTWFLSDTVLLLDVFPIGPFRLGEQSMLNSRYAMQWYASAALLGAWSLAWVTENLSRFTAPALSVYLKKFYECAQSLFPSFVILVTAAIAIARIQTGWPSYTTDAYQSFAVKLNAHMDTVDAQCRILSEDTGVTFHSARTVYQLYSNVFSPLHSLLSAEEVIAFLDQSNICVVVLYDGLYIDTAGLNTPIMTALSSNAFVLTHLPPFRIYTRQATLH